MTDLIALTEWANKLDSTKTGLDKRMFNEIINLTMAKLLKQTTQEVLEWLQANTMNKTNMVGPILLANNSKLIKDKVWSLSR